MGSYDVADRLYVHMYDEKSSGPKTEPCGTHVVKVVVFEFI